jgi:acyl carrier protein
MLHIEEKIKKVILEQLGIAVTRETLLSDIAEDSLSKVDLLFQIEQELDKNIPQDEVLDLETVGDLVEAMNR